MANEISKIKIGTTEYDIKDAVARTAIAGGVHFIGVAKSDVTDGQTCTAPLYKSGTTTENNDNKLKGTGASGGYAVGDMIIDKGGLEFIAADNGASGTMIWNKIGYNTFGNLAFKDSVSGSAASAGAHTHDVSASGTIASVGSNGSTNATVNTTNNTATVLTTSVTATVPKPSLGNPTKKYISGAITLPTLGDATTKKYKGTISHPTLTGGSSTNIKGSATRTTAVALNTGAAVSIATGYPLYGAKVDGETLDLQAATVNTVATSVKTQPEFRVDMGTSSSAVTTASGQTGLTTSVVTGHKSLTGGSTAVTFAEDSTNGTLEVVTAQGELSGGSTVVTLSAADTTSTGAVQVVTGQGTLGTSGTNAVTFDTNTAANKATVLKSSTTVSYDKFTPSTNIEVNVSGTAASAGAHTHTVTAS